MITFVTQYGSQDNIVYGLIRVDGVIIGRFQIEQQYWKAFQAEMKDAQFTQGFN